MRLYGTEGGFARREGAPAWRGEVCLFAPAELEAVHLPAGSCACFCRRRCATAAPARRARR